MCFTCALFLKYRCIFIFIKKYRTLEEEICVDLVITLMVPINIRKQNQTQIRINTLSLIMFNPRTHMAWRLSLPPPIPYLWYRQAACFGNTWHIGLNVSGCSLSSGGSMKNLKGNENNILKEKYVWKRKENKVCIYV